MSERPLQPSSLQPAWVLALEANFGSVDRWREQFVAMARTGGSGWVVLAFQPRDGTLLNLKRPNPNSVAAGDVPLLALECSTGPEGFQALLAEVDWAAVHARYQAAVDEASEAFGAEPDDVQGQPLLDVRRAGLYAQEASLIEGARWRDPAKVGSWAGELPAGRAVIVYCVYGHEVGRATTLRLRAAGIDARFLRGGIDAWKSAGRPLMDKP